MCQVFYSCSDHDYFSIKNPVGDHDYECQVYGEEENDEVVDSDPGRLEKILSMIDLASEGEACYDYQSILKCPFQSLGSIDIFMEIIEEMKSRYLSIFDALLIVYTCIRK